MGRTDEMLYWKAYMYSSITLISLNPSSVYFQISAIISTAPQLSEAISSRS